MSEPIPRVIVADQAPVFEAEGLHLVPAISSETVGASELLFGKAISDPGVVLPPHIHSCETAAYVVRGNAIFEYGENLEHRLEVGPGDYVYVPQGVVHTEATVGDEPAEFIFARDKSGGSTEYLGGDVPEARLKMEGRSG